MCAYSSRVGEGGRAKDEQRAASSERDGEQERFAESWTLSAAKGWLSFRTIAQLACDCIRLPHLRNELKSTFDV